ncbi:MAG: Ig-like domain-containing protein [Flavobacteriales bacterium]|nr:Ig-like domain-containing protein [Flavobacteriales bacterium]
MRARGLIPLLALITACAQVRDPTGGAKDDTPPLLLRCEPANGTTGFAGTRIILAFDERIRLDRVRNNLLISPPVEPFPEVRQLGADRVLLELTGPLAPNTTYVFNFGEAVVDLTEGNSVLDLNLVLSTGDHIDSLSLNGSVRNAYSGAAEKGVSVLLFTQEDTVAFRSGRPIRSSRTAEDGTYRLPYLAEGNYLIRALRDQNGNYRYDLPNEDIGFLPAPVEVVPGDTTALPLLEMFRELSTTQQLLTYRVLPDRAVELVLGRPADSLRLIPLGDGAHPTWTFETSSGRDSALAWPSDTTLLNGLPLVLVDGSAVVDTITYRTKGTMPFQLEVQALDADAFGTPIRASRPIAKIDPSRIEVVGDTAPTRDIMLEADSTNHRLVRLRVLRGAQPSGKVRILPKALKDIYGGWNDSLIVDLNGPEPKTFGTVAVNLQGEQQEATLLLLLDDQGREVRRSHLETGSRRCVWERVPPGPYRVRMILDNNGNGRWDPGSLRTNSLPEPVLHYPDPVQVRAAWEIGLEWEVGGP